MTKTQVKSNGHKTITAEERVMKCGEAIQRALDEHKCQMFTALKVGNAETPLTEIGGLPIVVKIASQT